jgi:hypothetical protein
VKRYVLIASLVLGLAAIAAPLATPAAGSDAKGPACGNVTDGDGSYTSTGGDGALDFTIQLQAPACSTVKYSLVVTNTSGSTTITPASSRQYTDSDPTNPCTPGTSGGGCVHFNYLISPSVQTVCIYATTAIKGHIVDSAPNASATSCTGPTPSIVAVLDGAVGASGNFG